MEIVEAESLYAYVEVVQEVTPADWEFVDENEQDACPNCVTAIVRVHGRLPNSVERSISVRCTRCGIKAFRVHNMVTRAETCMGTVPPGRSMRTYG